MRWVGWWIYLACWVGISDRHQWWSVTPPVINRGYLFSWADTCLEIALIKYLPPLDIQTDKCIISIGSWIWGRWRKYVTKHMEDAFNQSYINVIDKNTIERYNNSPPWFMFVGSELYTFGNERHKIWCGITYNFCTTDFVELKYRPAQLSQKLYLYLRRTVGRMIHMCKTFFSIRKIIFMDSVFSVAHYFLHFQQRECMSELSSRSAGISQKLFQGI